MASWKEERDRLVAQTLAFVQQVAAVHPGAAQKFGSRPAAGTGADDAHLIEAVASQSSSDAPDCDELIEPPQQTVLASLDAHVARPSHASYSNASERSDIGRRVAAFKARQSQLLREREAYYDRMQSRIRASLQNSPGAGKL